MKNKAISTKVVYLHNLCVDDNSTETYRPISAPKELDSMERKLLTTLSDGRTVTASQRVTTIFAPEDRSETLLAPVAPKCACEIADGRLLAMTDKGAVVFGRDEDGNLLPNDGEPTMWNGVSVTAEAMTPVQMTIEGVTLSQPYNPGDEMTAKDREKVSEALKAAYKGLCGETERQGVFFQPMIARVKVRDAAGSVLFRGPELLIMPPSGPALDRAVTLQMSERTATEAVQVEVGTYRLRVQADAMTEKLTAEKAAKLEIEVSPAFHVMTSDKTATGKVNVVRTGNSGMSVSATMPGAEKGLSRTDDARNARLIKAMLSGMDEASTVAATIGQPYVKGVNEQVSAYGMPGFEKQAAAWESVLTGRSAGGKGSDLTLQRMNAPHGFTAALAASTPGAVAYGDVKALMYPGYSPEDYASEREEGAGEARAWTAKTTVSFSDGRKGYRITKGKGRRPTRLNALTVYPDPTATRVEIVIEEEREGAMPQRWTIDLEADASGERAIGITGGLEEREGVEDPRAWIMESETKSAEGTRMRGMVAIAKAGREMTVTGWCDMGEAVTAIVAATSASGGWDFGRTRFVVFTESKVVMVNVSQDMKTISTGKLADVGVKDEGAVTVTDEGQCFFVTEAGHVFRLEGNKVKTVTKLGEKTDRLGYDRCDGRLVGASSAGEGPVYHVDRQSGEVSMTTTSAGAVKRLMTAGSYLLAETENGIMDMAVNHRLDFEGVTHVTMTSEVPTEWVSSAIGMKEIVWRIDSSDFEGRLTVRRKFMTKRSAETLSWRVKGRLGSPMRMPLRMRPFWGAEFEMDGEMDSKSRVLKTIGF